LSSSIRVAMNLSITIGIFMLGAGIGALTTLMLQRQRIRHFGKSAESERYNLPVPKQSGPPAERRSGGHEAPDGH
jgi:hypothetical protein